MATLTHVSIEEDFAAWAFETADLLEERRFDDLDIEVLAEEVRDLGRSESRSLESQLERLLIHLMKWAYQPSKRSKSWELSISDARRKVKKVLGESPSLRPKLTIVLTESWPYARRKAAVQTRLGTERFPESCPWDLDRQVLNVHWLPEYWAN